MKRKTIITNNGKPTKDGINIPDGMLDEAIQERAIMALNSMRRKAAQAGFKSEEEIEALISEARNKAT